jgi:hypothetical protein
VTIASPAGRSGDGMAALRRAGRIGAAMHGELCIVPVRHQPYWRSVAEVPPIGTR